MMNRPDDDPMRLYHVFNESFNKIAKQGDITYQEFKDPAAASASEFLPNEFPQGPSTFSPDSPYFPFGSGSTVPFQQTAPRQEWYGQPQDFVGANDPTVYLKPSDPSAYLGPKPGDPSAYISPKPSDPSVYISPKPSDPSAYLAPKPGDPTAYIASKSEPGYPGIPGYETWQQPLLGPDAMYHPDAVGPASDYSSGTAPPTPISGHSPFSPRQDPNIHPPPTGPMFLDDALNVLKTHADISKGIPFSNEFMNNPVLAQKNQRKRKSDNNDTSMDDLKPSSSDACKAPKSRKKSRKSDDAETAEDDSLDPETKGQKDTDRRWANNVRERVRIRDINDALKELGRICMTHQKSDKPQTKLGILNIAVDVIMSLEQQVRERNLNPKVACLKRREEGGSSADCLTPDPGMMTGTGMSSHLAAFSPSPASQHSDQFMPPSVPYSST